jgi:hypothetical protein
MSTLVTCSVFSTVMYTSNNYLTTPIFKFFYFYFIYYSMLMTPPVSYYNHHWNQQFTFMEYYLFPHGEYVHNYLALLIPKP